MNDPLANLNLSFEITAQAAGQHAQSVTTPALLPADGLSPHIVIRGETTQTQQNTNTAIIDWLAFTVRFDKLHTTIQYLKLFLENAFSIPAAAWKDTSSGWNGYDKRINIGEYGLVAYGGNSQKDTIHIEINAGGCSQVKSWQDVIIVGEDESWKITRIDLAHDDLNGHYLNIAKAKQWFMEGLFSSGGRAPSAELIDDFDSGKGKTLYIGNRKNGKLLRIYEKGRQLGDPNSEWCRAELELRSKDRIIPWSIISEAGAYLAGSYKALNFLNAKQSRLKTNKQATKIKYESMVRWMRTATGKGLNAMLLVEQGDVSSVFNQLQREGLPLRLNDLEAYLPPPRPDGGKV